MHLREVDGVLARAGVVSAGRFEERLSDVGPVALGRGVAGRRRDRRRVVLLFRFEVLLLRRQDREVASQQGVLEFLDLLQEVAGRAGGVVERSRQRHHLAVEGLARLGARVDSVDDAAEPGLGCRHACQSDALEFRCEPTGPGCGLLSLAEEVLEVGVQAALQLIGSACPPQHLCRKCPRIGSHSLHRLAQIHQGRVGADEVVDRAGDAFDDATDSGQRAISKALHTQHAVADDLCPYVALLVDDLGIVDDGDPELTERVASLLNAVGDADQSLEVALADALECVEARHRYSGDTVPEGTEDVLQLLLNLGAGEVLEADLPEADDEVVDPREELVRGHAKGADGGFCPLHDVAYDLTELALQLLRELTKRS